LTPVTIVPPGFVPRIACSTDALDGAKTMLASTPPMRASVSPGSPFVARTTREAPTSSARARCSRLRETATTSAPNSLANWITMWPTPPTPKTATVLPGIAPTFSTDPRPVIPGQKSGAASANSSPSGSG
jgi:hypothetical protein